MATSKRKTKKKPIGRPTMAAEKRRETLIRVLTTEEERDELQRAADAAGLPISTWVRSVALSAARKDG